MNSVKEVNARVNGQSPLAGWDVMVAYNRNRVNKLFHEQYLNRVAAGENYPPFAHMNDNFGLTFRDIVLGPPLISFENASVADSAVTVRLKFISGSIIRTDSNGQVIQWDRMSPGNDYAIKIRAELKYGSGTVSDNGTISVHFNEGQLQEIEGLNGLPDEVLQVFREWLQKNPMTYTLGELKNTDNHKLYPKTFIIRTQRHPDAQRRAAPDNTDGAVLVFIETNYGGKGHSPADDQPWIIPDGKTAALFISEKLLFGPLLAENFPSRIKDFEWESVFGTKGESLLRFTKGYVPTTNVIEGSFAAYASRGHMNSSDWDKNERPARLSMADFQLSRYDDQHIAGVFTRSEFTDTFRERGSSMNAAGGSSHWDLVRDVRFTRSGKFQARLSLDKEGNVVFNGVTNFEIDSEDSTFTIVGGNPTKQFAREAADNLNRSGLFELADIRTFYIRSVLFPQDNILSFSDVAMPGDLALYGDVSESLSALTVSPEEIMVAAGQTLTLSAHLPDGTAPADLKWSVDGVGNIDHSGRYTAPAAGEITQAKTVIVTATAGDGRTGQSLVMVVPSALEVMTPFKFFMEGKAPESFDFMTKVINSDEKVTWTLKSDLVLPGTIDQNGVYTPPAAGEYEDGFNVVTLTARLPSGAERKALVCLCGGDTSRAFMAEPAYHAHVMQNSTAGFSVRSRDFDADLWELYPQKGSLSAPDSHLDGKVTVWTCDYTAPPVVLEPDLVFVKISSQRKPWQGGYGMVELLPNYEN